MLEDFESTARDVVTSRGARVVKTIGDAVMYIADDLLVAAEVVTALVEELQSGRRCCSCAPAWCGAE